MLLPSYAMNEFVGVAQWELHIHPTSSKVLNCFFGRWSLTNSNSICTTKKKHIDFASIYNSNYFTCSLGGAKETPTQHYLYD